MIKIDTDVPPPTSKIVGAALRKMNVGDSFLLGGSNNKVRNTIARLIRIAQKDGKMFTTMTEGDGVRVWRLE